MKNEDLYKKRTTEVNFIVDRRNVLLGNNIQWIGALRIPGRRTIAAHIERISESVGGPGGPSATHSSLRHATPLTDNWEVIGRRKEKSDGLLMNGWEGCHCREGGMCLPPLFSLISLRSRFLFNSFGFSFCQSQVSDNRVRFDSNRGKTERGECAVVLDASVTPPLYVQSSCVCATAYTCV